MTPTVAIFLKAPRLGQVKTRLAAEVGPRHALRLYRVLAARTLATVAETGFRAAVWYTPAEARLEMRAWLGEQWELRPQASGDLGARLAAAAHAVDPFQGWLAIGGDCPGLTTAILREAADALQGFDAVLGPAHDGGYYLIGGRTPLPDIFSDIPWSTPDVLPATRERLTQLGATWHELPVLRDIDTAADARALGLLT